MQQIVGALALPCPLQYMDIKDSHLERSLCSRLILIQIMFATNKFFVGARHPQSFGISNYLTGAVPLPICRILFSKWYYLLSFQKINYPISREDILIFSPCSRSADAHGGSLLPAPLPKKR